MNQLWHIITGEYPPQPGGVADYTHSLARGLAAAGDQVSVWAPAAHGATPRDEGVNVHRLGGSFSPLALAHIDAALARRPGRVLLQYTPHAFGYKAMNVPLCAWLWARGGRLDVMFHEVAFPQTPGQPFKHKLLAWVQRAMASLLLRGAERVFVSVPGWGMLLGPLASRQPEPVWTPVPTNLPIDPDRAEVEAVGKRLRTPPTTRLVGHFSTYSPQIQQMLDTALVELLANASDVRVVLLGRGGTEFLKELVGKHPEIAGRVIATGPLEATTAAAHVACCDVMLQPYPDGISSRRTSAMATLAQGGAVVTNEGAWSESIWRESGAVALASPENLGKAVLTLLDDPQQRRELGQRAACLYRERFAMEHTVQALRGVVSCRQGHGHPSVGRGIKA